MVKTLNILVTLLFFLLTSNAISQNIEGLQEIVKVQQEKISSIEK